jgi:hypothetical protein
MTNFKIMLLNLVCGAAIVVAIVSLQQCGGALSVNAFSEIQETCIHFIENFSFPNFNK